VSLDRVVVVGTSGSGKSTLARELAQRLDSPHVELDAIHWLPGWVEKDPEKFRLGVRDAVAGDRWVVDGNYARVRDLVWPRATAILWLDYRFPIVFWRALLRTVSRVVRREVVHGNRESLRVAFLSRYGIPWWVVRTHRKRHREFSALFAGSRWGDVPVTVLRSPRDAERFLVELPATDMARRAAVAVTDAGT